MPKVPIINGAKLIKVLKKKDFVLNRVSGSHHIFIHPEKQTFDFLLAILTFDL